MRNSIAQFIVVLLLIVGISSTDAQSSVDYETQIDPIFSKYSCKQCHGGDAGLFLDTYQHLMTSGRSAPVVVAGDTNSILIRRLKGLISPRMPQSGPITNAELQLIVKWIKEGASETVTRVEDGASLARKFGLSQNFPNPFNPKTVIRFSIPQPEFVVLKIYDMLGNERETLIEREMDGGDYEIRFDGGKYSSGAYFYRLQAGDFARVRTMILIK